MDDYGGGYGSYVDEMSEEPDVSQEDCWDVIRAFFAEKGLVRQQLDSFNEFVQNTMQELVDEVKTLTLEQSSQHTGREGDKAVSWLRDLLRSVAMDRQTDLSASRQPPLYSQSVDMRSSSDRSTSRCPPLSRRMEVRLKFVRKRHV